MTPTSEDSERIVANGTDRADQGDARPVPDEIDVPDEFDDEQTRLGDDRVRRCGWAGDATDYQAYHDSEWGFGTAEDHRLFEKVCLEGFQAGLSWLTVLRKRDRFRAVFADFDPATVARFGEREVESMLGDAGIIRHRGKIESTINNAQRALELTDDFGSLATYFWGWADLADTAPTEILATTPTSQALSKDLKRRGWSFVGPTTMYALMQAMGLVNDHAARCECRDRAQGSRLAVAASVGTIPDAHPALGSGIRVDRPLS